MLDLSIPEGGTFASVQDPDYTLEQEEIFRPIQVMIPFEDEASMITGVAMKVDGGRCI